MIRFIIAMMFVGSVYADNEIYIDQSGDNVNIDLEQLGSSNMIGGFPLRLDSNKKIVEYISMMAFYDYPLDYLDTFADKVNSVTVNQIKKAFSKRVNMDDFTTVIVGIE